MQAPVLTTLRQRIVPQHWSQSLKEFWRAQIDRPGITPDLTARLRDVFDADLAQLGSWLGIELDCENFHDGSIGVGLATWLPSRGRTHDRANVGTSVKRCGATAAAGGDEQ